MYPFSLASFRTNHDFLGELLGPLRLCVEWNRVHYDDVWRPHEQVRGGMEYFRQINVNDSKHAWWGEFYGENQRELAKIITHPCLPMPGVNQAAQQKQEATIEFRQARQRHPGVESAINALQAGNGLQRCRDRTETGFERYIQLGVLGRNLHVLGKILLTRKDAGCNAAESKRRKVAA